MPFEADEQDDLTLFVGQAGDRPFEIAQLQRRPGIRIDGQHRRHVLDRDRRTFAHRAPHVVDVLVMQDREQPGSQIRPGLPQMLLGNRAHEAALHQVVGPRRVPGQGPRVAPQAGDFAFQKVREISHQVHPLLLRRRLVGGRWMPWV